MTVRVLLFIIIYKIEKYGKLQIIWEEQEKERIINEYNIFAFNKMVDMISSKENI